MECGVSKTHVDFNLNGKLFPVYDFDEAVKCISDTVTVVNASKKEKLWIKIEHTQNPKIWLDITPNLFEVKKVDSLSYKSQILGQIR